MVILGLDPGIATVGFGVIRSERGKNEALSFEELVQAGGFDPDELNASLTLMTLRSIIVRLPGNQYRIA